MMADVSGTIAYGDFEESTISQAVDGPKIDRITLTSTYSGGITGQSTQTLLILYHDAERKGQGSGSWIGIEQITGDIAGQSGSIVLRQAGDFDAPVDPDEGHVWKGHWTVVPGSGTDDLAPLAGEGTLTFYQRPPHGTYSLSLGVTDPESRDSQDA